MIKSLMSYSLAALVAVTGTLSLGTVAHAGGSDVRMGIYVNDGYRGESRRGWNPPRQACSVRLAEDKARNMGIRRARVVDVSPRRVVVAGVSRHGRDQVVFANARGCPVIRR